MSVPNIFSQDEYPPLSSNSSQYVQTEFDTIDSGCFESFEQRDVQERADKIVRRCLDKERDMKGLSDLLIKFVLPKFLEGTDEDVHVTKILWDLYRTVYQETVESKQQQKLTRVKNSDVMYKVSLNLYYDIKKVNKTVQDIKQTLDNPKYTKEDTSLSRSLDASFEQMLEHIFTKLKIETQVKKEIKQLYQSVGNHERKVKRYENHNLPETDKIANQTQALCQATKKEHDQLNYTWEMIQILTQKTKWIIAYCNCKLLVENKLNDLEIRLSGLNKKLEDLTDNISKYGKQHLDKYQEDHKKYQNTYDEISKEMLNIKNEVKKFLDLIRDSYKVPNQEENVQKGKEEIKIFDKDLKMLTTNALTDTSKEIAKESGELLSRIEKIWNSIKSLACNDIPQKFRRTGVALFHESTFRSKGELPSETIMLTGRYVGEKYAYCSIPNLEFQSEENSAVEEQKS